MYTYTPTLFIRDASHPDQKPPRDLTVHSDFMNLVILESVESILVQGCFSYTSFYVMKERHDTGREN